MLGSGKMYFQAIARQKAQLVVLDQGIALDKDVGDRVQVVLKSGQRCFSGYDTSPEVILGFEHQNVQIGFGKVGRGGEPVMAAAHDDHVVLRHGCPPASTRFWDRSSTRLATARP
jgi:hypothetical protein